MPSSLEDFRDQLVALSGSLAMTSPPLSVMREVKEALADALLSPSFRLSCVDHVLRSLAAQTPWTSPPLVQGTAFALRMFVWRPGQSSGAHRHLDWGVTGVMCGSLDVTVHAEGADVPAQHFESSAGSVGYLVPPCTHCITNTSQAWAVTLHVFGGPVEFDSTSSTVGFRRGRTVSFQQPSGEAADPTAAMACGLLAVLDSLRPPNADYLGRCLDAGGVDAALAYVATIAWRDPTRARAILAMMRRGATHVDAARIGWLMQLLP